MDSGAQVSERRLKQAAAASAFFCAGVVLQVVLIAVRGEPFCLNTGCHVVEGLVELNPALFNMMGAAFFASCALTAAIGVRYEYFRRFFQVLCLSGMAAEGILLSYQAFVAGAWCSYCLVVFAAIVVLNILAGLRQFLAGAFILCVEVALFSLLNFNISTANIQKLTLDNGTCAITRCAEPANTLYLIFSQDCPHCHKVLEALAGCSRCEFHFNPVKKVRSDLLPGTAPREDYVPEINRLALNILGIDSIPVLVVRRRDGYLLIRGDVEIIEFIRKNCFRSAGNPGSAEETAGREDDFMTGTDAGFLEPEGAGGACSLEDECVGE